MTLDDDLDDELDHDILEPVTDGPQVQAGVLLLKRLFDKYRLRIVMWESRADVFGRLVQSANPHGGDLRNMVDSQFSDLLAEIREAGYLAGYDPDHNQVVITPKEAVFFISPAQARWEEDSAFARKKQQAIALLDTAGRAAALALFTEDERKRLPF